MGSAAPSSHHHSSVGRRVEGPSLICQKGLVMSNSGSGAAKVAAKGAAHRAAAKGVAHGAAKTAMAAPKSKLLLATAKFTGPPAMVALTALWASGIVPSGPNPAVIHESTVRSPAPCPCLSADAAILPYLYTLRSAFPALMSLHVFSRPSVHLSLCTMFVGQRGSNYYSALCCSCTGPAHIRCSDNQLGVFSARHCANMVTNNKPRGDGVISGIFGGAVCLGPTALKCSSWMQDAALEESLGTFGRVAPAATGQRGRLAVTFVTTAFATGFGSSVAQRVFCYQEG